MEKKSFLIYLDCAAAIACLPDELAGLLFKALLKYAVNGTLPQFQEPSMMGLFTMFRVQIDRDAELYEKRCQQNKTNATKRYRPKSEPRPSHATADDGKEGHPPEADIEREIGRDKDSDRDTVNDIVIADDGSFEFVFRLYDKTSGNKEFMRTLWLQLSDEERALLMKYIPVYVVSTPEVKYRKNFDNFLSQRYWESHPLNIESYDKNKPINTSPTDRKQAAYQRANNVIQGLAGITASDAGSEDHSGEV